MPTSRQSLGTAIFFLESRRSLCRLQNEQAWMARLVHDCNERPSRLGATKFIPRESEDAICRHDLEMSQSRSAFAARYDTSVQPFGSADHADVPRLFTRAALGRRFLPRRPAQRLIFELTIARRLRALGN
jgi:hypothetical protein